MEIDDNTLGMIQETHDAVTAMRPVVKDIRSEQEAQGERVRQLELNERELSTKQEQMEVDVQGLGEAKEKQSDQTEDRFWKTATFIIGGSALLLGIGNLALALVRNGP